MVLIQMINDLCSYIVLLSGGILLLSIVGNGALKMQTFLDQEAEQKAQKGITSTIRGATWIACGSAIVAFFTSYI